MNTYNIEYKVQTKHGLVPSWLPAETSESSTAAILLCHFNKPILPDPKGIVFIQLHVCVKKFPVKQLSYTKIVLYQSLLNEKYIRQNKAHYSIL